MANSQLVAQRGLFKGLHSGMGIAAKAMVVVFVVFTAINVEFANSIYTAVRGWIENALNWYYIFALVIMLFVCFYLMFSRFGRIRLGDDDSRPEFSNFSWLGHVVLRGCRHRSPVLRDCRTDVLLRQHPAMGLSQQSLRGPGGTRRHGRAARRLGHARDLLPTGGSMAGQATWSSVCVWPISGSARTCP